MKEVRFGIVGCGGIARKAFLPALRATPGVRLTAVTDLSRECAEAFARDGGAEAVLDLEHLLARPDVDAVYVATFNSAHATCLEAAAYHGKHILCEKPLVSNGADARRLLDLCERKGVAVLEGFAYQHHTQHRRLRELVDGGRLGKPVLLQAWFGFPPLAADSYRYRKDCGGGALLDAGSYTVHVARRFFGREPVRIAAALDRDAHEVEIHGTALLDFGGGQTASLAFGFDNFYRSQYTVWGTRGQATLLRAFAIPPTLAPVMRFESQDHCEEQVLPPCDQFAAELAVFCAGLEDEPTRRQWRTDALAQASALDAIRDAARLSGMRSQACNQQAP